MRLVVVRSDSAPRKLNNKFSHSKKTKTSLTQTALFTPQAAATVSVWTHGEAPCIQIIIIIMM